MSSMETSENNVYRHICSATDVRNVLLKITTGIYKNTQIPTFIYIRQLYSMHIIHRLSNIFARQDATLMFSKLPLPSSSPPHKLVEVFLHSVTFGHISRDDVAMAVAVAKMGRVASVAEQALVAVVAEVARVVAVADMALVAAMDDVGIVVAVAKMDPVASVRPWLLQWLRLPWLLRWMRWFLMFCITIGSCSRCKIIVTKYHLLQFGLLWGKMANSPTCPSQFALLHISFVCQAFQHELI